MSSSPPKTISKWNLLTMLFLSFSGRLRRRTHLLCKANTYSNQPTPFAFIVTKSFSYAKDFCSKASIVRKLFLLVKVNLVKFLSEVLQPMGSKLNGNIYVLHSSMRSIHPRPQVIEVSVLEMKLEAEVWSSSFIRIILEISFELQASLLWSEASMPQQTSK